MQTGMTSQTDDEPTYKCPICHDTYWKPGVDKYGRPVSVECDCWKVRQAEKRIAESGLKDEMQEKTFKNFKAETDWQRNMKDVAIAYGKAFFEAKEKKTKLPWFVISGQPGCGKTHLCTALCGALLNRGVPVTYMQWVTESRKLRAVANDPDFDTMLEPFIDIEVLYIDDLFKQRAHKDVNVSDAEARMLFEILNKRYFMNKATVISTEWYLESELMALDDGTFSRVYERAKGFMISVERDQSKNYRIR